MIGVHELAIYLLGAANTFYPQSNHNFMEPKSITEARYHQLAEDIAEVSLDPKVAPLFSGEDGRVKTGLLLVSLAYYESMFISDVMTCKKLGDHGQAFGPYQTHRSPDTTCQGTVQASLVALDMIRESFQVCHSLKLEDRLSEYTDGNNWQSKSAHSRSENRMHTAMYYFNHHPITK